MNAGQSRPAGGSRPRPWAGVGAFALTATVLAIARLKAPFTILLAAWLLLKDYLGGLRYVGYGGYGRSPEWELRFSVNLAPMAHLDH